MASLKKKKKNISAIASILQRVQELTCLCLFFKDQWHWSGGFFCPMILIATKFCAGRLFLSFVCPLTTKKRSKEDLLTILHVSAADCSPVLCEVAGNLLGQHCSHQFVSLLPLHLQLLCPLSNQILQVGGVLLQHAQHAVNDVGLFPPGDALELRQGRDASETYQYKRGSPKKVAFQSFHLFEDLLEGLPPLWLFTPGLFHNLYHIQRCLVHWHLRSAQRRRRFDLADNLCQDTKNTAGNKITGETTTQYQLQQFSIGMCHSGIVFYGL